MPHLSRGSSLPIKDFSRCVAAQILGLGGIDSTNSTLNIRSGPRICAVVGGAGGTAVHEIGAKLVGNNDLQILHGIFFLLYFTIVLCEL